MPHRLVDEPAPGAFGRHAVKYGDGLIRQNDVDAFAHGKWVGFCFDN
jgi:hypothetical protein